jgi:hypothetical protein
VSDEQNPRALAIIPRNIAECTDLAERLAKSTLLPEKLRNKVPDVLMTIMAGQEMGLAPMAALRSFHVIEGKPVMSADGMAAVVLGSGKAAYFRCVSATAERVVYETLRVGDDKPQQCEWTIEMAKRAALHQKDNWRAYPRAMLASRARSELARSVYPDVLAGCYTDDEMGPASRTVYNVTGPAVAGPPGAAVIDAEFTDAPPAPPSVLADIDAAQTEEELAALVPRLSALTGSELKEARDRYRAARVRCAKPASAPEAVAPEVAEPAPGEPA